MINSQIGSTNTMMNETVANTDRLLFFYPVQSNQQENNKHNSHICIFVFSHLQLELLLYIPVLCILSPLVCCFQPSLATQKTESFTLYLIQGAQWNLKTNSVHIIVELSVLFPKLKLNCFQKYFAFAWLSLIKMGGVISPTVPVV